MIWSSDHWNVRTTPWPVKKQISALVQVQDFVFILGPLYFSSCSSARFIVKLDDDATINWKLLLEILQVKFVVYFDQLLGATHTQKLVETFFQMFSTFFVHFRAFSVISRLKSTKNVWKWTKKKCFFGSLVIFLVIWFSIYSVLWFRSTVLACTFGLKNIGDF